jgi:homoserine dehydrogenase
MCGRVIVLKFGGSVLTDEDRLRIAVHEVYRWRREGWKVVAVVSAFAGRTDELLTSCQRDGVRADGHATAAILSCGERESAAKLVGCLDRVGVTAALLDPASIGLRAHGPALDAQPLGFDADRVRASLDTSGVVVVPGFLAIDDHGRTVTLGRGGSDLSALVLADGLGADRCRLLKDVDGLYERDPACEGPPPRRFERASFGDALRLDGSILQHKAVRFARERGLAFEVGRVNAARVTAIGDAHSVLGGFGQSAPPLGVALLGVGVVGGGVLELLTQMPDRFEVVAASVRDVRKHEPALRRAGVGTISTDPVEVAGCGADIVVEAIGGIDPAREAIAAALESGAHVVTANKAVLATHGEELFGLAESVDRRLLASASVGGGAPVLEAATRLGATRVRGVLNGTANFVLSRLAEGASLEHAVAEAQQLGLAEADPSRDLDGRDSLDKLRVLALSCGIDVRSTELAGANVRHAAPGGQLRQVATLEASGTLSVAIEAVEPGDPLFDLPGEWNAAEITGVDGRVTVVRGRGAGRWATAEAVVADVLGLERCGLGTMAAPEPGAIGAGVAG